MNLDKIAKEMMELKDREFKIRGDLSWKALARWHAIEVLKARIEELNYAVEFSGYDKALTESISELEAALKKLEDTNAKN